MAQQLIVLKKEKKIDRYIRYNSLQTLPIRTVPDWAIVDWYLRSFLKVQLQTKQLTIYSYFSGPVLNNELFFANGKILPIFVNQTKLSLIIGGTQIITNK